MGFFDELGAVKWIILSVVGCFSIWAVGAMIYRENMKKKNNIWLEENSNASKIFIKQKGGTLSIIAIDNDKPRIFLEGRKSGFYLNDGEHIIESTYLTISSGILGTRSTTYGPSKQRILIERNKTYEYSFNLKEKHFEFIEYSNRSDEF